jgi:catechol 2,3-dioxygenase-like lactoylglutathione lyase family enzyme
MKQMKGRACGRCCFSISLEEGRNGFDSSWARRVDSWERTFYQDRLPQLPYSGSTTNSKMKSGSAVKALGEIALRINNLERMKRFYQEVLGFEASKVLGEFPTAALLKIAAGYAGHTQVLGLFDRSVSMDQEGTTVDHIAFTIGLPDYDSERKRLETLGLNVEVQEHQWVNWRSLYFHDPRRQPSRTGLLRRKSERI